MATIGQFPYFSTYEYTDDQKQTFNFAEQIALTTSSIYLVRLREFRSATSLSLFCSVNELSFFTKTLFFFTELSKVLKKESGGWCAENNHN